MADETNNTTPEPINPEEASLQKIEKQLLANPSSIPDQYRKDTPEASVANFMQSYKELRGFATKTAQENAELKKQTPPKAEAVPSTEPTPLGIPDPPKPSDLWTKVEQTVSQTGDLPPDLREEIKKAGIPDSVIETTLNGYKAQRTAILTEAASLVGGDTNLKAVQEWAAKSLAPEERQAANAALNSPAWKTTLVGLHARWAASQPTAGEPRATPTGAPNYGSSAPQPFRSEFEKNQAFADPRYKQDPMFRQEVTLRLQATLAAQQRR